MKANNKDYILMPLMDSYAQGVKALSKTSAEGSSMQPIYTKRDGSWIVRPLTFRENLQARIEDYNTLNNADGSAKADYERLRLFNTWLDSCTGIAYKAGTTKFKIVHQSLDLIEIPSEFEEAFLGINYDSIDGIELDSSKSKCNLSLTKKQVISHPAWLAAVENDSALLSESADIVFRLLEERFRLLEEKYKTINGMAFLVRENTKTDELWALFVNHLNGRSSAGCVNFLDISGSFLRVAPSQNFSTKNKGEKQ